MIRSGVVSLARVQGRLSAPWLASSALLFLLQFIYPAIKVEFELQFRPPPEANALFARFMLDGVLTWIGLQAGSCVSGGMYRVALKQWRGEEVTMSDLGAGFSRFAVFVPLSFGATLFETVAWISVSRHLAGYPALLAQLVLIWIAMTPFLFVVPLIVDRGLTAFEAIKASAEAVQRGMSSAFFLLLSAGFWSQIGALACFVGAVLTLPTYHLAISRAYLDCFETEPATETA